MAAGLAKGCSWGLEASATKATGLMMVLLVTLAFAAKETPMPATCAQRTDSDAWVWESEMAFLG